MQQHALVLEQALYCLLVKAAPPAAVRLLECLLYVYQELVQRLKLIEVYVAVAIRVVDPARHQAL